MPRGARLNEQLVKTLTGGDHVRARKLYEEFREFRPQAKTVIVTNSDPEVSAGDEAMFRRIHKVPFNPPVPAAQRDLGLSRKLEAEVEGILAFAVEGCLEWQQLPRFASRSLKMIRF